MFMYKNKENSEQIRDDLKKMKNEVKVINENTKNYSNYSNTQVSLF
jgi:hypothetical protein